MKRIEWKGEHEIMTKTEGWKLEDNLPVSIPEVVALLRYAAENSGAVPAPEGPSDLSARFLEEAMHVADSTATEKSRGGDGEGSTAPKTPEALALAAYRRVRKHQEDQAMLVPKLYEAVVAYEKAPESEKPAVYAGILALYSRLTRLTAPVTGQSIIETREGPKELRYLYLGTLALVIGGLSFRMLGVADNPAYAHCTPFIWGALGSCVFLLKYLYDIAQIQAFDSRRLKGLSTRVALGAILGAIVVQIAQPNGNGEFLQEREIVAFLAGIGVRVVYGALEKLVQLVSDKLNLEPIRKAQLKDRPDLEPAS